jgi:protein-disulfide isomerase
MSRTSVIAALLAYPVAAVAAGAQLERVAVPASSPPDAVVATVHGTYQVRQSDVDAWRQRHTPAQLARLRQELYESGRQAVDALIGEYLLGEAAGERGISVEAFVNQQVDTAVIAPVREEDVREIYERSISMLGNVTFDQAKSAIRSYLEERSRNDARKAVITALLASAAGDVVLTLEPPRYEVPIRGDEASLGPESAIVTLVEYADFQCPFCGRAAPDLKKLVERYRDTVRLVWRHFPLAGHPDARGASEAAACAGEQDTFWEYHDQLFANQGSLGATDLRRYAEDAGLDVSQFDACVQSHRYESTITDDMAGGDTLGISATPAVFINGRLVLGAVGYDVYERIVDEELRAARITAGGKP